MSMKTVRIAELKAHLSVYLHAVRKGARLRIMDRNTPVAELVPLPQGPLPPLPSRGARGGRPGDFVFPAPLDPPIDTLAELLDDRKDRF